MNKFRFFTLFLIFILFMACASDEPTKTKTPEINLTRVENELVSEQTEFAFRLFDAVNSNYSEYDNFVISPINISTVLSMVSNGIYNEDVQEILRMLGYEGYDIADINKFNSKMSTDLQTIDKSVTLLMANSIWYSENDALIPEFSENMANYYNSDCYSLCASNGRKMINDWAAKKTNGQINELLSNELSDDFGFVLANATYFKGAWQKKFNREYTKPGDFNNIDNTISKVKYMSDQRSVDYAFSNMMDMIALPFGNGAFELCIILPDEDKDFNECVGVLAEHGISNLLESIKPTELSIKIPKVTIKNLFDMKEALKALGIQKAFNRDEIFIVETGRSLGLVNQSTSFILDEEGATAASAGFASGLVTSPGTSGEFVVNRPFIFVLRENSTGAILFVGKVTKL